METKMDQDFCTIQKLPDEMLLMIFENICGHQLLISVSKVCRRWRLLISHIMLKVKTPGDAVKIHGSLRALLVTSYLPTLRDPSALISQIATTIPNLKELTISADYFLDESELKIIETMHSLRHLDIFTKKSRLDENTPVPCNITSLVVNDSMCQGFLLKMEKQKVINAFHMYGKSVYYPSAGMDSFLKHHSLYLTELTLRCSELKDSCYKTISQCEGLTSLQLYSCAQLTHRGASYLTNLLKLRRLHLTGTRMLRINASSDFIQNLPRHIVELSLSNSWFGDEHCSALAARLPNLRYLELWRSRVSDIGLVQLVKLLTSLEDLDTDVIFTNDHIKAFSGHPFLKNIRCRCFSQILTPNHLRTARFYIKSAACLNVSEIHLPVEAVDQEGPRAGYFYYWLQDINSDPAQFICNIRNETFFICP